MKADLLLKLADLLDSLPPNRFDYGRWADQKTDVAAGLAAPSCGTSACALGWATTIPELGLELRRMNSGWVYVARTGDEDYNDDDGRVDLSIASAMHVFGLTAEETDYLFVPGIPFPGSDGEERSPGDEATATEVAAHIRDFVADRTAQ